METRDINESEEAEVKRPRRSCVLIENKAKQESDSEMSESESEPDNDKDEDFSLTKPRKPRPKSAKKERRKKEKIIAKQAPSYNQVENAHRSLEQRLYEKHYAEYDDEDEFESDSEEEQQQIEPEPVQIQEPVKKKRIVIRPWNPGWYQIPQ